MTALAAALFGLAFGSFSAAAGTRLARGRSLTGRSACDACGRPLAAWELVPVLGFVLLRGRCSTCRESIGLRAPLIEALHGLAFVLAFAALPPAAAAAACAAFTVAAMTATTALETLGAQR
jgi:prepilin signal peptidase PulO-like enzyme (type II secretory pathway)